MSHFDQTVIEGVKIFTGASFIESGHVRFAGGQILEVGDGFYQGDKAGVHLMSCPGATLIPGLIDSHIHALGGNVQSIEQSLRFGVTTVCDMHNDPQDNDKLREVRHSSTYHPCCETDQMASFSYVMIIRTNHCMPTSNVPVWER